MATMRPRVGNIGIAIADIANRPIVLIFNVQANASIFKLYTLELSNKYYHSVIIIHLLLKATPAVAIIEIPLSMRRAHNPAL